MACARKALTSPGFDGNIIVLLVFANFLKASMYCSANVKDAAFLPSYRVTKNISFNSIKLTIVENSHRNYSSVQNFLQDKNPTILTA